MESDLGIEEQNSMMEDETKDYDVETSSSDEESDDEDELKKLENSIDKDNLLVYHPEIEQINYNELITLSKIVRDKYGNPIDPLHTTFHFDQI